MKKILTITMLFVMLFIDAQVGIGTSSPHASALLELSATDKGFKGPDIALLSKTDVVTIPNPQRGLLVFNVSNSGIYPDNVVANEYYFWNGTQWVNIAAYNQIEELLEHGLYVLNESDTQTFPTINDLVYKEITFPSSVALVDKGGIVTKSGNIFTINRTGLYELNANVNYNPTRTNAENAFSLLNVVIERKRGTGNWEGVAYGRRVWGASTSNIYQTAFVPNTCVYLQANDQIRFVISNPLSSTGLDHGSGAHISATSYVPVSKSISIQLLNY